jgi:hypothetical protein
MAQAIAEERAADFIRVAEANRKARGGAQRGAGRRPGWLRSRRLSRAAMLCEAGC